MAVLNAVKREIVAKIVYYGPGLSGKTANIQKIHDSMDPANVGDLTSLATESDRTLFFDFVPIQLGTIAGLNTRFQLFTVPGQVFYNQTRRTVLENSDGVVFVADSQPEQLENNIESLRNLEENLAFYGKKLTDVPFVLQFNKQDIPGAMTEEELNKVLNKFNAPSLRASCIEGFGVMETLAKISTMVLAHLREQMTKKSGAGGGGIKRTYSKEGISDDQVVKNLMEDIAAAGGVQEAQKAGDIPQPGAPPSLGGPTPPPPPKMPAPSRASGPAPTAPPKPVVPRVPAPSVGGSGAKPIAASAPTQPMAKAPGGIAAEDLLSDLDSAPAKPTPSKPAAPAAPAPPSSQRSAMAGGTPTERGQTDARMKSPAPTPPPQIGAKPTGATNARLANPPAAPAPPARGNGTPAGLRMSTPPPAKLGNGGARTAEELLDSLDKEERSVPSMSAESDGSFGPGAEIKSMWDDSEGEATPGGRAGDGDGDGKTNISDMKSLRAALNGPSGTAPRLAADPMVAPAPPPPSRLEVAGVGAPVEVDSGVYEVDVTLSDGRQKIPVKLSVSLGMLAAPPPPPQAAQAPQARSGGGGFALALALVDFLAILAVAGYVLVTMGPFGHR